MKKARTAVLVVVVLLALALSSACVGLLRGSGNLETKEFNLRDFTQVDVGTAFQVEIIQSDSYSVSITADDNIIGDIEVYKEGKTLRIGLKQRFIIGAVILIAKVTMPDVYRVNLSGATRGAVAGFSNSHHLTIGVSGASFLNMTDISADDVDFDISGASRVSGEITASDIDFNVSGASGVQLRGSASDIIVEASGASNVELGNFSINNADVQLSGASRGTVNLDGRLDARLSGASNLSYIGEPTIGTINVSDASTLSKKEDN